MFLWRKYHKNHQYHCNAIPYFSLVYYIGECFGFTWPRTFLGKTIGCTSFIQTSVTGYCEYRMSALTVFTFSCSHRRFPVFYPLVCVCAQRSGTHLVRIHWKLFCRNEHRKNSQTIFYDVKYPKTTNTFVVGENSEPFWNAHTPHIQYIRSNYSSYWEFFMCHFPFLSFRFLCCRNMPELV